MLSARNILDVEITEVKTGAINSLIVAKLASGDTLKATVTVDSQNGLDLKAGKKAVFIIKASSVIIVKGESEYKLSAANQIKGKVVSVKDGAVNAEVAIDANGARLSAIITNESVKNMALEVGDEITAIIKATQMIVGVK